MTKYALFVCKSCFVAIDQPYFEGRTGGEILLKELTKLYEQWSLKGEFRLIPVKCMSICKHPCSAAVSGPAKTAFAFGDLSPFDSADAILAFAEVYFGSEAGIVSRVRQPAMLRERIVARIPTLPGE
ncbi:MAG: DUF1636 domain-containing protein [Cyanobacteria bacterium P01_G01_bin.38]